MIEVEGDFRCGTGSYPAAKRPRTKEFTIENTNRTASGADELIVELNRRLIALTDQHVITKCKVKIEYEDPF